MDLFTLSVGRSKFGSRHPGLAPLRDENRVECWPEQESIQSPYLVDDPGFRVYLVGTAEKRRIQFVGSMRIKKVRMFVISRTFVLDSF